MSARNPLLAAPPYPVEKALKKLGANLHPRNHAIIAKHHDWKLSPAYDLTPTNPISLEHRDLALICGDRGRYANAENLISQSMRFLIKADHAYAVIAEMEHQIVSTWYEVSRGEGVSEQDCKQIAVIGGQPRDSHP